MKHSIAVLSMAMVTMTHVGFAADGQDSVKGVAPSSAPVGLTTSGPADPWRMAVSVPLWAAGVDGTVKAGGHQADLHVPVSKIADHLDAAAALAVEVRKENYGFFADGTYMKLSADGSGPHGDVHGNLATHFFMGDAGGFYRLVKVGEECPFILEATAGVRYWRVQNDLTIVDQADVVLLDRNESKWLLDPVFGLRASQYICPKLHVDVLGDIGGFGVSHESADLDWSATAQLTYDFTQMFSLSAGYKAVGVQVSPSVHSHDLDMNLIFNGALVTARFNF